MCIRDSYKWITQWRAEAEKFAIRDNPAMDYLAYAVILKNVNIAVGAVGCSYYEDLNEIGITYFIGAQYRNNGYAVEAVKAYTEFFFNHYKLHKMARFRSNFKNLVPGLNRLPKIPVFPLPGKALSK